MFKNMFKKSLSYKEMEHDSIGLYLKVKPRYPCDVVNKKRNPLIII